MLDKDFWDRFAETKAPGEHMHTLVGGARVYCTRPKAECSDFWDLATEPAPTRQVVIPGSLNEHRLAQSLVEGGGVARASVMQGDYLSFEAWRVSPATYAWRSAAMAVPAFMPVVPDTRPDVYGMPRWEWDLYR